MAVSPEKAIVFLVLLFGVSIVLLYIFNRLGLPSLLAYLFAGIILNPSITNIIEKPELIHVLSELGVIFLLFSIGLEFSIEKLKEIKKYFFYSGIPQVFLTIIISAFILYFFLNNPYQAVFLGMLLALSSTAIVFKILSDRGEIFSPHGKIAVAILLFQDLCIAPFMLLVPLLGEKSIEFKPLILVVGKTAILIFFLWILSQKIIPVLFYNIVKTRSRELFIGAVIFFILAIPLVSYKFGLSFSLGAFLAGLVLSRSEYAHQVLTEILPLRDTLIGFLFISIGLLINIPFLIQNLEKILLFTGFIIFIKFLILLIVVYFTSKSWRISLKVAISLSQIGEFSFVLALAGKDVNLIPDYLYQSFLVSAIITMLITPFGIKFLFPRLYEFFSKTKEALPEEPLKIKDHIIIIGFGVGGRNLAKILKILNLPYVILELNPETVKQMRKKGEPIYFGDGTSKEVLKHLNIKQARVMVVVISDATAVRRIVAIAKSENPNIYLIVRTRFLIEVDELKALGADEVVPEELISSIEISARVLTRYNIPLSLIDKYIDMIRKDNYLILRTPEISYGNLQNIFSQIGELQYTTYILTPKNSLVGKTLKEINFRKRTGATVVAIQRKEGEKVNLIINPDPELPLEANDILLIIGTKQSLEKAIAFLEKHCSLKA